MHNMYGHHTWRIMDQRCKVANPARGQLNRENEYSLSPLAHENLVSRDDGFGRPVMRQPAHSPQQRDLETCYRRRECRILRSHTHLPSRRAEGILARTRDRPGPA